jgi:hypothetical protein
MGHGGGATPNGVMFTFANTGSPNATGIGTIGNSRGCSIVDLTATPITGVTGNGPALFVSSTSSGTIQQLVGAYPGNGAAAATASILQLPGFPVLANSNPNDFVFNGALRLRAEC